MVNEILRSDEAAGGTKITLYASLQLVRRPPDQVKHCNYVEVFFRLQRWGAAYSTMYYELTAAEFSGTLTIHCDWRQHIRKCLPVISE